MELDPCSVRLEGVLLRFSFTPETLQERLLTKLEIRLDNENKMTYFSQESVSPRHPHGYIPVALLAA
jgi:hypothetical protein